MPVYYCLLHHGNRSLEDFLYPIQTVTAGSQYQTHISLPGIALFIPLTPQNKQMQAPLTFIHHTSQFGFKLCSLIVDLQLFVLQRIKLTLHILVGITKVLNKRGECLQA